MVQEGGTYKGRRYAGGEGKLDAVAASRFAVATGGVNGGAYTSDSRRWVHALKGRPVGGRCPLGPLGPALGITREQLV